MQLGPIEIFRTGSWTSMNGQNVSVTPAILAQIASGYAPDEAPAPAVIGHPKTDAPAYAWADRVYVEGDKLLATLTEAATEFVEWVRAGRYKKVSVALHLPDAPSNPTPGKWYLKHIGFLGGAAPAVSGLAPIGFSGRASDALVFEENSLAAERAALARERAELRVEKLMDEGRLLPVHRDDVLSFMDSLDADATFAFSDGQRQTQKDWFLSFLQRQPKVVEFGALRLDDMEGPALRRSNYPAGYVVDPSGEEIVRRAQALASRDGVSFAEAVRRLGANA